LEKTTSTADPIVSALYINVRELLLVQWPAPRQEPKCLSLEAMQPDIDRLITSLAFYYTDQSCMFLHTDDLESEGQIALVNVIAKGWLLRARSREEFFRILKTAVANRLRSLVQQHRFTQKRTGIKPPPKHERRINFESHKPNEISLDDPNAHLQVSDHELGQHEDDYDSKQLAHDISERCDWFTRAVFKQLTEPDLDTLNLARLDACRGKPADRVKITITNVHRALAAGPLITPELFEKAVLCIQSITRKLLAMTPEDERYDLAVARLAQIFGLQVPKSTKPMVVRRMFTVCARDNWQRVDPEVEELLATVGAVAPRFNKESMSCLGVLYQKGHKVCESCGVKVSCATQAANLGLTEITLPPKLLGAKLNRVPTILPTTRRNEPPSTSNLRDMAIVDYLFGHFNRVTHQGETYFQPSDFKDKQKMLFCIGERCIPFRLRFCGPSPEMKKRLVSVNKGYYASDTLSANEVIALINEHAKMAYA
jgi:uncharacterized protein (UPF0212 family)